MISNIIKTIHKALPYESENKSSKYHISIKSIAICKSVLQK